MITLSEFREAFNALRFVERADLIAAGIAEMKQDRAWAEFCHNPLRWVLRAPREQAEAAWRVVQASGLPNERTAA